MRQSIAWLLVRFAWIALIILIALGSAGLVTGLDHRPGTPQRAELTWQGDSAIKPGLDSVVVDLAPLSTDFDALGAQARTAIAALVSSDPAALDAAIVDGQALVDKITAATTGLQTRLRGLPGIGPSAESRLSPEMIDRWSTADTVLGTTSGIAQSWAILSAGSLTASQLSLRLTQHDQYAGEAVRLGSQAQYQDAVKQLDLADPTLLEARALRDRLANTADVSVLDQWLARNAAIDAALRRLYVTMAITNGRLTPDARQALTDVETARAALPPDTRALVVIMSDVARGGLNQAVIQIEEARGRLADAMALLNPSPGNSSGPFSSPGPLSSAPPASEPTDSSAPGSTPPPVLPTDTPETPSETPFPSLTPPDA